MSTKFSSIINRTLNPQKSILLVGNSNEFDIKLAKNMPEFKFFVYLPNKKWDYTKFIPPENLITFGNKNYVLFNEITFIIGSHCSETVDVKNTFPYLPLISLFHNEPLSEIPFFPKIERKNYGQLCLSNSKKVAESWVIDGKVIPDFTTRLLVKEIREFYENSIN